jgi:peptide/nickel transport system substrate-binding protein
MSAWRTLVRGMVLSCLIAVAGPGFVAAQTKPQGEMRFALYVTLAPAWLDPGEAPPGFFSPFWLMYGVHDALVKPMPGNNMAPSLAESWTESEDHRAYEFNLRKGVKFHNGDPFTAEDVVFSFKRAKGVQLHEKVKEVVIVDPHKVRFVLHEPWPDFMAISPRSPAPPPGSSRKTISRRSVRMASRSIRSAPAPTSSSATSPGSNW